MRCTYLVKTYNKRYTQYEWVRISKIHVKTSSPNLSFNACFRVNFEAKFWMIPQNMKNYSYIAKIYEFKRLSYSWKYLMIGEICWNAQFFSDICIIFVDLLGEKMKLDLSKVLWKAKNPKSINFQLLKYKYIRNQKTYGLSVFFCHW